MVMGVKRVLDEAKPWKKDPNYFRKVRISAVALLKMVMHARSGGSIEIMGLMVSHARWGGPSDVPGILLSLFWETCFRIPTG